MVNHPNRSKRELRGETFTVKFDCINDAFENSVRPEIVRILRDIASHVENGGAIEHFQTIRDINGNDVGRFALKVAGR